MIRFHNFTFTCHFGVMDYVFVKQLDLKFNCHVAAGEESEEVKFQKDRETTVREAVYPRVSAIPPRYSNS